ncbi:Acetylxylan esterase precursor [Gemmata obscuriglobus]|uniref:Alpha/beta hydrolase n=1 Tax=Gemmata obscuriglobus TaxID=114 RepID=A0A2Z3H866_9BACT|nr:alpha/beta hydrolase [Gemmata obscuriglobus]AWM40592.1 alpha/beta hydrolase [Gemmata obscuriglobus]QEG26147.1 Acetylxylan esterase precursor [Gemmata obscuriglobus]VTS00724.1 endo- -beta-xylanase : Endo-1,4-beta-xylanase B OS=uncultured planctomycete GN=HGMM_F06C06C03 PE=4 SV=1: Abhydrolase_5 [Gemmata obscuriglobus UQM 2246]
MLPLLLLTATAAADPAPQTFPLWPGKAPLAVGDSPTDKPELTAYRPEKPNGTAVVVCPGGGYGFLANDHEGKQVAEFFVKQGVTAFVLKYRIVTKDRPGPLGEAPLLDAQRALRLVRAKAKDYGIDPHRVGIMGFSAGGHLASTAATHYEKGDPKNGYDVEKESCRPDFAILAYPVISMEDGVTHGGSRKNLLGDKPDAKLIELYSNEKQVKKDGPPAFIFHTSADTAVVPENAVRFYLACKKAGVPVEMHIYEKGRHGVGLGSDPKWTGGEKSVGTWPDRLSDWLTARELLPKAK